MKEDPCFKSQLLTIATNSNGTSTHGVQLPTQDCEPGIPNHDHAVLIPNQACEVQVLNQACEVQILYQDFQVQIPDQDPLVQIPNQDCEVRITHQDHVVQIPNQNHVVQISNQDHVMQILNHDCEVQITNQDHVVRIPNQNNVEKIPNQDNVVKIKDHEVQIPSQDCEMQSPNQDCEVQITNQDHVVQITHQDNVVRIQDHEMQITNQDHVVQIQNQDHAQIPKQDHELQILNQDHEVKILNQDRSKQIPNKDCEVQIQNQDHGLQIPNQDHDARIPNQDHELQIPTQDHIIQLLKLEHSYHLPSQGHGFHPSSKGHMLHQLPARGHEAQPANQSPLLQLLTKQNAQGHGVNLPNQRFVYQVYSDGCVVQLPWPYGATQSQSASHACSTSTAVSAKSTAGVMFSNYFNSGQTIQQFRNVKSYTKKKKIGRPKSDCNEFTVPLDEYYYGRLEGDPTYQDVKDGFRFVCSCCGKVLYNNFRTMLHINRHVYPEWIAHFDHTVLAVCPKCNRHFGNPFEMQTHYDKDHLKKDNPECRICELNCVNIYSHMEAMHNICEMPYTCQLCKFRSSMHGDVVDHFFKKHSGSEFLMCFLCLHMIRQSGNRANYYNHLATHVVASKQKNPRKCRRCKLTFNGKQNLDRHLQKDHLPYRERVKEIEAQQSAPRQVEKDCENSGGIVSLNVSAVKNFVDTKLIFPPSFSDLECIECKMSIGIPDHFRKYSSCPQCRFATNCWFSYSSHVISSHSDLLAEATSDTSRGGRMEEQFYCSCGFVSNYGNIIANHLVACSKISCSKYVCPASALEELDQDVEDIEIKEEIESEEETDTGDETDSCDLDSEVKYSYTQGFSEMVDEDRQRYAKALTDIILEDMIKKEVKEEETNEI